MDDLQVRKYIMEETSGYVFTIHIEKQNMFKNEDTHVTT